MNFIKNKSLSFLSVVFAFSMLSLFLKNISTVSSIATVIITLILLALYIVEKVKDKVTSRRELDFPATFPYIFFISAIFSVFSLSMNIPMLKNILFIISALLLIMSLALAFKKYIFRFNVVDVYPTWILMSGAITALFISDSALNIFRGSKILFILLCILSFFTMDGSIYRHWQVNSIDKIHYKSAMNLLVTLSLLFIMREHTFNGFIFKIIFLIVIIAAVVFSIFVELKGETNNPHNYAQAAAVTSVIYSLTSLLSDRVIVMLIGAIVSLSYIIFTIYINRNTTSLIDEKMLNRSALERGQREKSKSVSTENKGFSIKNYPELSKLDKNTKAALNIEDDDEVFEKQKASNKKKKKRNRISEADIPKNLNREMRRQARKMKDID